MEPSEEKKLLETLHMISTNLFAINQTLKEISHAKDRPRKPLRFDSPKPAFDVRSDIGNNR